MELRKLGQLVRADARKSIQEVLRRRLNESVDKTWAATVGRELWKMLKPIAWEREGVSAMADLLLLARGSRDQVCDEAYVERAADKIARALPSMKQPGYYE